MRSTPTTSCILATSISEAISPSATTFQTATLVRGMDLSVRHGPSSSPADSNFNPKPGQPTEVRRPRFTPGGGIFSGRHYSFLPLKRIRQIATFGQETKDQRLLAVVERRLATTATGISSRGAWRDPLRHFAGRKATRRRTCQFCLFLRAARGPRDHRQSSVH